MTERRWLVGLRRAWIDSGALESWVEDRGVNGVIWTPAAYEIEDVAPTLAGLVEAGARPDADLLWDLAVADVQAAADVLRTAFTSTEGTGGFVVAWLDPGLSKEGRAAKGAASLLEEVGVARTNVAVGMAWHPKRERVVEQLAQAGVPLALSAVRDEGAKNTVQRAHQRGCAAREVPEGTEPPSPPPLFFLGGGGEEMAGELDLFVPDRATGRVPLSPEAESAGHQAAIDRLTKRAEDAVRNDAYTPELFARGVAIELKELDDDDVLEDIWARDHTIWKDDPSEITDRLGWLEIAETMAREADDIIGFARKARSGAGITQVLLCGMGGSSLGAQTLARAGGSGLPLLVLDTTHPGHISKVCESVDWAHTLVVVGSKSGTTVETRAHLEYIWSLSGRADRFVVVTDQGTELAALAGERGFLRVFENPPDIGGRFSALSYFGLVPAALAGTDIRPVLHGARRAMASDSPGVTPGSAPGVRLGAAMAVAQSKEDRDKLTLVLPRRLESLGPWIEQLVAESVGKEGTGVLPVVGEYLGSSDSYGTDRFFCAYTDGGKVSPELEAVAEEHPMVVLTDTWGMGAEMFRWEMATAVLGYLLDVNPFDQPDVEAAKEAARRGLDSPLSPEKGDLEDALSALEPPRYVAIQAWIEPSEENTGRLEAVRRALRARHKVAVTVGFGPQFLHSTGQFHKGGPNTGVFLQVTDGAAGGGAGSTPRDIDIPGMGFSFGQLLQAQADGDLVALRQGERVAVRTSLVGLEKAAGVG